MRTSPILAAIACALALQGCAGDEETVNPLASGGASSGGGGATAGGRGGDAGGGGQGSDCTPGEMRSCYDGPAGTEGVGLCQAGQQICAAAGSWAPCEGSVLPAEESCTSPFDEDCDGLANEEGEDCTCVPGETLSCYTGPQGTLGVGACSAGAQTCALEGTGYGPCEGDVVPSPDEVCKTVQDDDCDGEVNEECVLLCAAPVVTTDQAGPSDVASFDDGSFAVTGGYQETLVLGPGEPNETALAYFGGTGADIFIARYAADCSLLWAKRAGGLAHESGLTVTVMSDGHLLVTGGLGAGPIVLAEGEPNEVSIDHPTGTGFIAKLDETDGSLMWLRWNDSGLGAAPADVAVDGSGGFYGAGTFGGEMTFGAGEPNEVVLTAGGMRDNFLARYAQDGQLIWVRVLGGEGSDGAFAGGGGVAASPDGGAFITSSFYDTMTLGAGEPNETTLVASVGYDSTNGMLDPMLPFVPTEDIFVAHYAEDGQLVWAKSAGGSGRWESGRHAEATSDGGVIISGVFTPDYWWGGETLFGNLVPTTFGAGEPNETVFFSQWADFPWDGNLFVARYDANGALAWARQTTTTDGNDEPRGMVLRSAGDIVMADDTIYASAYIFAPGEPSEMTLTGSSGSAIAGYDLGGMFLDAGYFGAGGYVWALDAAPDSSLVVTGLFVGTVTWGLGEPGEVTLTPVGPSDLFVARRAP